MHVIDNALNTDQTIEQNTELTEQGIINANVDVLTGATFIVRGRINGNLSIGDQAQVQIHGLVNGSVQNDGGRLEVFGRVEGVVRHQRGETRIADDAEVREYVQA
jgi:cytoskeletal protein CcmA (bactofilin family)